MKSNYGKCLGVHLTKRSVQQFSTNLIPMHPFSTPWKHHGDVQKGSIGKNGLKSYKLKTTNTTRILKKVFWRNFKNFSRGDFTLLSILNPMWEKRAQNWSKEFVKNHSFFVSGTFYLNHLFEASNDTPYY